jgi:hypothetical protein
MKKFLYPQNFHRFFEMKMKWKNVSELPPLNDPQWIGGPRESNPVLAYDKYGNFYVAKMEQYPDDLIPKWIYGSIDYVEDHFTHWMELPQPPNEKN